jgi:pyrroline-5-carboxylate reductase
MKLCIIGCGNMGLIYAQFLLEGKLVEKNNLLLIEKDDMRRNELRKKNIGIVETPECTDISNADLILISVKPQDFTELSTHLKGRFKENAVVISIMAGVTIDSIQKSLSHQFVVRAMPNAPALYGKGMTVFCTSKNMSASKQQAAHSFLELTGVTLATENEEILDAVTALSGSGPAYFFYLSKNMVDSAVELGMDPEMAETLVKQTLIGAGEMITHSPKTFEELIKTVASKGGTTEAAINHFNENTMNRTIVEGIERATKRSVELSESIKY